MVRIRRLQAVVAGTLVLALGQPASARQEPAPLPDVLENYQPVTAQRLEKPKDDEWLMLSRTYNGWGYSPLDEINTSNVGGLRPVW